jgi:ATPase subunit of ABC transporter with duplicated ATPase domains
MERESSSPEETERIAAELAADLEPGDVVTISGDLGSGKTTFVRGACRALGVEGHVTSPSFTIGHRYLGVVDVSQSTCTGSRASRRRSGAISSRTLTAPCASSSGPKRPATSCPSLASECGFATPEETGG